jgi:hypothetical protein
MSHRGRCTPQRLTRRESSREVGQVMFAAKLGHCLSGWHNSSRLNISKPSTNRCEGLFSLLVALIGVPPVGSEK